MDQDPIIFNGSAYLPGTKTAVTITPRSRITEPATMPLTITSGQKEFNVVKWGKDNSFPDELLETCFKSPIVTAGMLFNINCTYGDGVIYGSWHFDNNGRKVFRQKTDIEPINDFFLSNDIDNYIMEQANDLCWFYNVFPEIILNAKGHIVELRHKEAAFSRWGEMNPNTGLIDNHFYSANWADESKAKQDADITPVLSPFNTIKDLKDRIAANSPAKNKPYRYIIPINMPSPGRSYYQKPYWYSIIESGWLEYSQQIPEFKAALLQNQMVFKYHVELSDDYFTNIFQTEKLTTDEEKFARVKKEYQDLNKFLTNVKNSGKTVISFIRYDAQGKELRRMKINVIDNKLTGGEYIQDSEEASNIISYGLGVHPSLIGSSPGKNKNISGSEARELFIIKQSMLRPFRDRILRPLYIVKALNQWPKDIDFVIPNTTLKTLDAGTGSEKIIS